MAKIERTKNATRNIIFGTVLKVYQIVVPFIMRTAMLYLLGVKYLGLNSLFQSILQVLNLAELGVGSAMVYSMYKPIVEDDTKTICALMKLYRLYYRIIGLAIGILGLVLLPFLPNLIKGDIPSDINIYILYLLNLSITVLSYWLFAYKNCILNAYQRIDISSKISIFMTTIQFILQLFILIFLKNYYIYLIIALIAQIFNNIVTYFIVNKMYPQYKAEGSLKREEVRMINQRIRDLFTAKLGGVIVSSVDTIVISMFLGLTILAVYQNYYYIMNSVISIVGVIFTAVLSGIGNSIIVDRKVKVYSNFRVFSFLINWIICICITCLICLYQPFMKIWVGNELMLDFKCVILFAVYFYIFELAMIWATYKDAAGLWNKDRFRPLIGAIVNLILNIILVNFIGIYGVLLSTILSYIFISMPWLINNLFRYLFMCSPWKYVLETFFYGILILISSIIAYVICNLWNVDGWLAIVWRVIASVLIANVVFIVFNISNKRGKEAFNIIKNILIIKSKKGR